MSGQLSKALSKVLSCALFSKPFFWFESVLASFGSGDGGKRGLISLCTTLLGFVGFDSLV